MGLDLKQRDLIDKLTVEGLGGRSIAQEVGLSYGTVRRYLEGTAASVDVPALRAVVFDLETTNLRSDIGALVVGAFLDLNTQHISHRTINDFPGSVNARERALAVWCADQYWAADLLIGFNSLGFDRNFLNGILARHDLPALPKRAHLDLYQVARNGWKGLPQSYSMANLADVFNLPMPKDRPSKHDWREANLTDDAALERIAARCVKDVEVTALLWDRLKPFWHDWRGR